MPATKRLNLNLPESLYNELQVLARQSGRSMTDVLRSAFALSKIAMVETQKGNTILVGNEKGKPIKEIIIPR